MVYRSGAPYQPYDQQQNHRADDASNDRSKQSATERKAGRRKQPPAKDRAQDADYHIADQSESATLDDQSRQPADHATDDDQNDEGHENAFSGTCCSFHK